jgi:hypothetical protein
MTITSVTTSSVLEEPTNEEHQLMIPTAIGRQGTRRQQIPSENENNPVSLKHLIHRSSANDTAEHGDMFAPGSLNMTLLESFRRCNVDTVSRRYKMHESECTAMAYSSKYGLAYHLLAKSASSTLRGLMRDAFVGKEGRVCSPETLNSRSNLPKEHYESLIHFTFFRDPLPRFISGYTEFMLRFLSGHAGEVPQKYRKFLTILDRHFHNLVEAKESYGDKEMKKVDLYHQLYSTEEGLQVLAQVFEQFVQDYDAKHPFDKHFMLQVPES